MRGYQFGATSGFYGVGTGIGIDNNYVEGASLTHEVAGSQQHTWTFAAGISEVNTRRPIMKAVLVIQHH